MLITKKHLESLRTSIHHLKTCKVLHVEEVKEKQVHRYFTKSKSNYKSKIGKKWEDLILN